MTDPSAHIPVFIQTAFPAQPELDQWQQIGEEEARVVYEMTLNNELSGGTPTVRAFEKCWREWIGLDYALTTFNGTTAIYAALFGVGVGPGDEVICPVYTWICTIAPALFLGATPVFVECDPQTLQMDPEDVKRKITPNTKAIVAVHLWGNVCDMDALMSVSHESGVPVIEDCSHAHGAMWDGRITGSIGQAGAWSLQGTKPVSAGEGGVMATRDPEIFERACLASQVNRLGGVDLATEKYADLQPLGLGMKLRAHPLGIGIANVQLGKLNALNRQRKAYVEAIESALEDIPELNPVKVHPRAERGGYYAFPIIYEGGSGTQALVGAMNDEGLNASLSPYGLLHGLKIFAEGFDLFTKGRGPLGRSYGGYSHGDFPVTEDVFKKLIFLPLLSDPVPGAVDIIVGKIINALKGLKDR
jgi:dTDP-4-amino-4,6-dideoxygalactose transaminase